MGDPDEKDSKAEKVRVNGKFGPFATNTHIKFPPEWKDFKKTSLCKDKEGKWKKVEERVSIEEVFQLEEKVDVLLIFALEPRALFDTSTGMDTGVCYNAIDPDIGRIVDEIPTAMSKKQRANFQKGIQSVQQLDDNCCVSKIFLIK